MVGYGITLDWQRFTSLCIGLPGFTIYTCMPVVYILYIDGVIVCCVRHADGRTVPFRGGRDALYVAYMRATWHQID